MSSIIDYKDRSTCVLFGDGAGAVVVSAAGEGDGQILDFEHEIDGSGGPALCMPAGGSLRPPSHETVDQRLHYVKQDGADRLQVRRAEDRGDRAARARTQRPDAPTISICSCRTRPTAASSSRRPRSSASTRQGHHQHRAVRQHDGGDDPAGAERRGVHRTAEEGRPRAAGVGRRRVHGRRGAAALGVLRCSRIFLLSPANCGGRRAKQVLSPKRGRSRSPSSCVRRQGATLGDVFSFVSGLYFRGKLTYARRFAAPAESRASRSSDRRAHHHAERRPAQPRHVHHAPGRCARSPTATSIRQTRAIDGRSSGAPRALAAEIGPECDVVLLGSVASPKYVDVLPASSASGCGFPIDFVGRGDMSRGGLLLRKAREGVELEYAPVAGAVLHGARPPKLPAGNVRSLDNPARRQDNVVLTGRPQGSPPHQPAQGVLARRSA